MITRYSEQLLFGFEASELKSGIPDWLENIRLAIPVRFIGIERLTNPSVAYGSGNIRYRRRTRPVRSDRPVRSNRTVRWYSDKLADQVQQTLTKYATLSQALDRTFPARLVETPTTTTLSMNDLTQKLAQVEKKRLSIIAAGLLVQEDEELSAQVTHIIDEPRRSVLEVYAQDALAKLSVFDDLHERVSALKRIVNARFLYKEINVSTEGLKVSGNGFDLDLEMLSSGEQHELVLLYNLLFETQEDSLIMIDEPELSLHVAWQDEMLRDLQEMADLSNFRVLLATHSPQIIGDRWDLTIQLKGPNEQ